MATFTVQRQRANATATSWHHDGGPVRIEAADAVGAAIEGLRQLDVRPKLERMLLWEGSEPSGHPRIFHSGS